MRASRGEIKIEEILQMNDMYFRRIYLSRFIVLAGHPAKI